MRIKSISSVEEFKANVKVGDTLRGFATRREVQVTAVGETRFLYRKNIGKFTESVASMNPANHKWGLIVPESTAVPQQPQGEADAQQSI